ncbi:MAG: hypothetical protein RIT04_188 [Candidatus Parcubacteria bacterium]|jgi:DNA polymerase III delta subunit
MLYFLYGSDTEKARIKARELIASLQKKKPDAAFFTLNAEMWALAGENAAALISEYAGGQGLFSNKYIVLVDRVCEDKKLREGLVETVSIMADSDNIFIVLEGKLDVATAKKISAVAEKTQEFEAASSQSGTFANAPSGFVLADAFGRRDKKELWILYRELIDSGASPEELHGTLFWQIKSMLLAAKTKNMNESGLSSFVHTKSAAYAKNFTEIELRTILDELITVSHDARRGQHDLETALESLLLRV